MEHVVKKFASDFDSAAVAALVDKKIREERERCAGIADGYAKICGDGERAEGKATAECIAAEIREES
jgi:hypothetical protein